MKAPEVGRPVAAPENPDQIANWQAPLFYQPAPTEEEQEGMRNEAERPYAAKAEGDAASDATPQYGVPAIFVAVAACRLVDTRTGSLPFGGPPLAGGTFRNIPVASGSCGLPATAVAYSFNFTVVPTGSTLRWLTAYPSGQLRPITVTLTDPAGKMTSDAAVVAAGTNGSINVYVTDATNVIIDVNGYYALPSSLPMALGAGMAAAPALTFGTDATTGLFSTGAGTLSIATAGQTALTLNSAGNLDLKGSITKGGALFLHNLGGGNAAVGLNALSQNTGQGNAALGYMALAVNTTGTSNTAVGSLALLDNIMGGNNTAVGHSALEGNTTAGGNTAVGSSALAVNGGNYNTATGMVALQSNGSGTQNTATGAYALQANIQGGYNSAFGDFALGMNKSGNYNTAAGVGALYWNTGATLNTGVGYKALYASNAYSNTAVGSYAMSANLTGSENVALGLDALGMNTGGNYSVALGRSALYQSTGTGNIGIGYYAGSLHVSGDDNIYIGHGGVTTESSTIHIGDSGMKRTYIAGIRGVTTGQSDAVAVYIDSTGQLGTVSSSRTVKRDIADMGDTTETLMSLRPVQFRYIQHGPDSPLQYGLIAEEVAEVAPELVARKTNGEVETVFYDKVNALLLNEVQKLHRENEALKGQNEALTDTLRKIEARLAAVEGNGGR